MENAIARFVGARGADGDRHVMRGDERWSRIREATRRVKDCLGLCLVERARRLVGEDHARAAQ